MTRRRSGFAIACFAVTAALTPGHALFAQSTLDHPTSTYIPYHVDSGYHDNVGQIAEKVWMELVEIDRATSLRLYYASVELPEGSTIRVTSLLDDASQTLDASGVQMWSDTSGYFNGNAVMVELIAGPNTIGNRIILDQAETTLADPPVEGFCGIFGIDERAPSTEPTACRLLPVGCTATIWSDNSCLVSAGHCFGNGLVAEFNVPFSSSNCQLNHPPIEDQFPITNSLFENNGVGYDWMVNATGTNNLGETAFERYGVKRRIAGLPASFGDPVDVWGYAVDHDCTLTQTQQHSPNGVVNGRSLRSYEFDSDITFGNSGSSIIFNNEIVGIVTHCGGFNNFGTRTDVAAFADARIQLCQGELIMNGPTPKIAGQVNTLDIENGSPFEDVTIVYSIATGNSTVPGCTVPLLLHNPITAGVATADADGNASFSGFVSDAARGRNILLQAYESETCRATELIIADF